MNKFLCDIVDVYYRCTDKMYLKIHKRMMKVPYFREQAMKRGIVVEKCNHLGQIFAKHFVKCMNDISHIDVDSLHHHCKEMQSWWNDVRNDKIKSNNKVLTDTNLKDWFFSAGANYEDYVGYLNVEKYEQFIKALLKDRSQDIYELMCKLFVG